MVSIQRRATVLRNNLLGPRSGPMSRTCIVCGSQPGTKCQRYRGGRVAGKDDNGGYWIDLKNSHEKR